MTALILLISTFQQLESIGVSPSFAGLASQGVGRLNTKLMLNRLSKTIQGNVLVANTPQLIVSLLYLLYNDLFTRVHIAAQWDSYSRDRKMLRVMNMRQDQRNTRSGFRQRSHYVLSLPLRISLPLLVAMMILHWLISQSIFLAIIGANDWMTNGDTPMSNGYPYLGLGYSPFAIILALLLGGLMVVGLWVNALATKIGRNMPVVRSCSAAISAACHPPSWDEDACEKPLSYGVVEQPRIGQDGEIIPGRVSFTSGPVHQLVKGGLYS